MTIQEAKLDFNQKIGYWVHRYAKIAEQCDKEGKGHAVWLIRTHFIRQKARKLLGEWM